MKNEELYQKTFSQVQSSHRIQWEDMKEKRSGKLPSKKMVVLAAVVCLLAGLSTVAAASGWFGLRDLTLPKQRVVMPVDPETDEREEQMVDVISLQGYAGTPENQAVAEWQNFLTNYDQDGSILEEIGNGPTGLDRRYDLYLVYTREMADKLDEIVEKYGLSLHTDIYDFLSDKEVCQAVGGDFLGENRAYSAYMYEDGTFKFDGEGYIHSYGRVDYQFMRCVRGSFTDVILNVGDVSQYREWSYRTACGVPATLALGPGKALIIADLEDSFVTLNVLAGTETDPDDIFSSGPLSAENLEALADSFDFTKLTPAVPSDSLR